MPEAMHRALIKQADKLGLTGARRAAYIYGTLAKAEKKEKKKRK